MLLVEVAAAASVEAREAILVGEAAVKSATSVEKSVTLLETVPKAEAPMEEATTRVAATAAAATEEEEVVVAGARHVTPAEAMVICQVSLGLCDDSF